MRWGGLHFHRAAKLWYVRIDGHMTYAPSSVQSAEQADAWLRLKKLEKGVDSPSNGCGPDDATVADLVKLHLDRVATASSKRNMHDKARILGRFVATFGVRSLRSLKPLEVADWIAAMPARTSGAGKRQIHAHVAACFNWAKRHLGTTCNPLASVDRPKSHARGDEYTVDAADWPAIHARLRGPYADAAAVLWLTGARPAEVLEATVDELQGGLLIKKHHKTAHKGGIRHILVNDAALAILTAHAGSRKDGLIFRTKDGRPLCERWLNERIQWAAQKCGRVKPICCYSLRRSFAVRHLERGVPPHVVCGWLGNSLGVFEKHYSGILQRIRQTRHHMD